MCTRRSLNELPCFVGEQSVELGLHCLSPVGVLECLIDYSWDWR
jgi:hypothetical protein